MHRRLGDFFHYNAIILDIDSTIAALKIWIMREDHKIKVKLEKLTM
jgi:hypothetical protein